MNKMDKILLILGGFLLSFIICMIVTYWVKGGIPDTLVTMVLGAGGLEAFICAWIKNTNTKSGGKDAAESEETDDV